MVVAIVPLVVMVVGLLLWSLSGNAKIAEIGRWMFIIGLFWLVGGFAKQSIRF